MTVKKIRGEGGELSYRPTRVKYFTLKSGLNVLRGKKLIHGN